MGMTMVEKILAAHAGRARVVSGEYVWAKIDETNAMYDTFEDILTPYIRKLQGATAHVGTAHAPAGQPEQAKPDPVADLKAKLQEAISRENYEEAARLRDEIRRLEGQK